MYRRGDGGTTVHGTAGDDGAGRSARRGEAPPDSSGRHDSTWLDELDDDGPGRPRRALLVLAALPWLLVIALLVLPGRLGGDEPADVQATGAAVPHSEGRVGSAPGTRDDPDRDDRNGVPEPGAADAGAGVAAHPAPEERSDTEVAGADTIGHRDPIEVEAGALAIIVARGWLTGLAPVLDIAGTPPPVADRYAEHLVVEAIDRPGPEAAVVRVVAVVLSGSSQLEASIERLAVPLALTPEGPQPAGAPWPLRPPTTETLLPAFDAIDDAEQLLAAREALADAGFDPDLLVGLGATSGWPVIATLSDTTTPEVWLVRDGDGFLVAGTAPHPAATPAPGR
jgi:hypothetical protein